MFWDDVNHFEHQITVRLLEDINKGVRCKNTTCENPCYCLPLQGRKLFKSSQIRMINIKFYCNLNLKTLSNSQIVHSMFRFSTVQINRTCSHPPRKGGIAPFLGSLSTDPESLTSGLIYCKNLGFPEIGGFTGTPATF